jgi:hypothetical protein
LKKLILDPQLHQLAKPFFSNIPGIIITTPDETTRAPKIIGLDDLACIRAVATASHSWDSDPNNLLMDKGSWNAGGYPPQWIKIDLLAPKVVKYVRIQLCQSPDGFTKHVLTGASAESPNWTLLKSFEGVTKNGDWISCAVDHPEPLQYILLTTEVSPSWVAHTKIEVYGINS